MTNIGKKQFLLNHKYEQMKSSNSPHEGWDCFVLPLFILPLIDLGKLYLGYSGWDVALHFILKDFNRLFHHRSSEKNFHYKNFHCFNHILTFHIEDKGGRWRTLPKGLNESQFVSYADQSNFKYCPRLLPNDFSLPIGIQRSKKGTIISKHRYQSIKNCEDVMFNFYSKNLLIH